MDIKTYTMISLISLFVYSEGVLQYFHNKKTWIQATKYCDALGGHLDQYHWFTASMIPDDGSYTWSETFLGGILLWTIGCYDLYPDTSFEYRGNLTSRDCLRVCIKEKGIAMVGKGCYCQRLLSINSRRHPKSCNRTCMNSGKSCGAGDNKVDVSSFVSDYTREQLFDGTFRHLHSGCGTMDSASVIREKPCVANYPAICMNESMYWKTPTSQSWFDTEKICQMAIVNTKEDSRAVRRLLAPGEDAWIGLRMQHVISTAKDGVLNENALVCEAMRGSDSIFTRCNQFKADFFCDIPRSVIVGPDYVRITPDNTFYTPEENRDTLGPITCSAYCYQECSYEWLHDGSVIRRTASLTIKNITRSATGMYQCRVNNAIRNATSADINVSVEFGPGSVRITPDNAYYTPEEAIDTLGPITCSALCYPECSYEWLHGGSLIGTTASLTIKNITRSATGMYQCRANNTISSATSYKIYVSVQNKPEHLLITPLDLQYTLLENDRLEPIRCSATCNPLCQYRWKHDGVAMTQTADLNIDQLKRSDSGIYVCEAWNKRGAIESRNINIEVQYAPDIPTLIKSGQGDIMENQPVSLTCTTDSVPLPDMRILSLDTSRTKVLSHGQLNNTFTIQKTNCLDTGEYTCKASNRIGSNTSNSLMINVLCSPHPDFRIVIKKDIFINDQDSLNLTATIIANPRPISTWMFKMTGLGNTTTLLNSSDGFEFNDSFQHVVYTSQIIKSALNPDDYGQYILKAANSFGEMELRFNVYAKRSPYPPYNVSVVCTDQSSSMLTWKSNSNGGFKQHFIVKTFKESLIQEIKSLTVDDKGVDIEHKAHFDSLDPDTRYSFTIEAHNKIGSSSLDSSLNCTTNPEFVVTSDHTNLTVILAVVLSAVGIMTIVPVLIVLVYRQRRKPKNYISENCAENFQMGPINASPDDDDEDNDDDAAFRATNPTVVVDDDDDGNDFLGYVVASNVVSNPPDRWCTLL